MKVKEDNPHWKESYEQPRQHIKKQRHYFANKGPSSQGYGFSRGHVWMWQLDYKEIWVQKNWCFSTVVLEKTLESPLDCKEIQPVHPEGDPDAGKDWGQAEKGRAEDEMVGCHHWLNGHGFGWTLGVGDGQGGLACCKESDTTECLNWTDWKLPWLSSLEC